MPRTRQNRKQAAHMIQKSTAEVAEFSAEADASPDGAESAAETGNFYKTRQC
jgi:hypothetical protein